MKKLFLFGPISLFIVYSCRQEMKHTSPNGRLLSFQSKLIYTVDDLEKLDNNVYQGIRSDNFNSKTDTVKYFKGEIYISYLRTTSGCSEYTGDIQFNKDTIKLLVINASDIVCSEENAWRVVYEIENKDNKKYVIQKY